MDYYDDDPTGDDEVTALWDGRLSMERVLKTLQNEIQRHKAAQARIAELEAEIAKWKELTGVDEPSWGAKLTGLILHGPGISTADITYNWKPAKSASDND